MKPKLYQYAACPFCHKVRALLQYKGVEYETIEVHPLNKKEISFSESYRKVPIYIDTKGEQVNDSNAIMQRIEEEFPTPSIYSSEPSQAKDNETWLAWSEKFVQGLPTVIYDTLGNSLKAFDYITKVGKFSWFQKRLIKYMGAFVMSKVSKKIQTRQNITDPAQFLHQMTREWSEGLDGRTFIGGQTPGVADIAVFGITQAVEGLPAETMLRENQVFARWMDDMKELVLGAARPEVVNA